MVYDYVFNPEHDDWFPRHQYDITIVHGMRGSGKTSTILRLVQAADRRNAFSQVLCIGGRYGSNMAYEHDSSPHWRCIDSCNIDPTFLKALLRDQKFAVHQYHANPVDNMKPDMCIILHNYSPTHASKRALNTLAAAHAQLLITLIIDSPVCASFGIPRTVQNRAMCFIGHDTRSAELVRNFASVHNLPHDAYLRKIEETRATGAHSALVLHRHTNFYHGTNSSFLNGFQCAILPTLLINGAIRAILAFKPTSSSAPQRGTAAATDTAYPTEIVTMPLANIRYLLRLQRMIGQCFAHVFHEIVRRERPELYEYVFGDVMRLHTNCKHNSVVVANPWWEDFAPTNDGSNKENQPAKVPWCDLGLYSSSSSSSSSTVAGTRGYLVDGTVPRKWHLKSFQDLAITLAWQEHQSRQEVLIADIMKKISKKRQQQQQCHGP